jgi:hypothetical protein
MPVCWVHKLFARIGQGCECRSVCCGHAGRQLLEQGSVSTVFVNCGQNLLGGIWAVFRKNFCCILVNLFYDRSAVGEVGQIIEIRANCRLCHSCFASCKSPPPCNRAAALQPRRRPATAVTAQLQHSKTETPSRHFITHKLLTTAASSAPPMS